VTIHPSVNTSTSYCSYIAARLHRAKSWIMTITGIVDDNIIYTVNKRINARAVKTVERGHYRRGAARTHYLHEGDSLDSI
jgi:hypothetical protein